MTPRRKLTADQVADMAAVRAEAAEAIEAHYTAGPVEALARAAWVAGSRVDDHPARLAAAIEDALAERWSWREIAGAVGIDPDDDAEVKRLVDRTHRFRRQPQAQE